MTRRELNPRQAETVDRVVAAALDELKAVGYDGLTVRSVAGRAAVAPATAYTYFSSKNHLVAEAFWRRLAERPRPEPDSATPLERVVAVFDDLTDFLAAEPELAAGVTAALLGSDGDVRHLQLMIGLEINSRITDALGPSVPAAVHDALSIAWAGALLQAGMGHARVENLGRRLGSVARLLLTDAS
ncbi:MAG TPA: helix-turn-helix domain-containing protein [Jatrophihabitantaceae bacterium]|nr:helix-turn-helix domain-containing protein [Jatrophihabitantaceae bacterium]